MGEKTATLRYRVVYLADFGEIRKTHPMSDHGIAKSYADFLRGVLQNKDFIYIEPVTHR